MGESRGHGYRDPSSRLLAGLAVIALAACGGDGTTGPDPGPEPAPTTGSIEAASATTGPDPDPDGYTVTLDDSVSQDLGVNDAVSFAAVPPGDHDVGLGGVAANCAVDGDNPVETTVTEGSVATAAFDVACLEIPRVIEVSTATSGVGLDVDGYTVSLDDSASRALGVDDTVSFDPVEPGNHDLFLGDVSDGCAVDGDNPRTVAVAGTTAAATTFEVTCGDPLQYLVSPVAFDFGEIVVGETSPQQMVDVVNLGPGPLQVQMAGGAAGVFNGTQNCQGRTLAEGEACQINYAFTPEEVGPVEGSTGGSINGQEFAFAFTGEGIASTGTPDEQFLISPTGLDFGEIVVGETSPQQMVDVVNLGPGSVTVNMAGGAAGVFNGTQNCQGRTLAEGEACQIIYAFTPEEVGLVEGSTGGSINGQEFAFTFRGVGVN